jgi:hypothetical protein
MLSGKLLWGAIYAFVRFCMENCVLGFRRSAVKNKYYDGLNGCDDMAATLRLQSVLSSDPTLVLVSKGASWEVARSIKDQLINAPKNVEILLPTPTLKIHDHLNGNGGTAIALVKTTGEAVAYAAYEERIGPAMMTKLGLNKDISGMAEFYCLVVNEEYSKGSMGIKLVQDLVLMRRAAVGEVDEKEFTVVVTNEPPIISFGRRTSELYSRSTGTSQHMTVFAGQEVPMLYLFETFPNPNFYSKEDIKRIEGTNPARVVRPKLLMPMLRYASGDSLRKFDMGGNSIMLVSDAKEALRTEAALREKFGTEHNLKKFFLREDYTI